MPSQDNTPGFTITVDGAALTQEESNAVHEIKVTDWLRLPDVCTVAVGYSADQPGVYTTFDSTKFKVGGKLEVKLGSAEESTTQSLFKGEIVTMEPAFTAGGVDMVVRAYDSSHKMMRTRKQRTFVNQTVSDIVTSVAGEYGFNVESDSSGGPLDFVLQHNETDWEFVWRMARRNGFEFLVGDDGAATFKKPNVDGDPVELRYTDGLSNFRPRVTAVMQVEEVSVRGFDLKAKQKVEQTA